VRFQQLGLMALLALLPLPALAQTDQDPGIVVRGKLEQKSDWNVAESDHVIVYSDGSRSELARITHNLERLHFLLSILLNLPERPDETQKLRVTLIGNTAEFNDMELRNARSQQGPFAPAFQMQRYYDPREDGAVLAASRTDMTATIEQQQVVDIGSLGMLIPNPQTGQLENSMFGPGEAAQVTVQAGGNVVKISAEGRLYAGFAQHFLLTYFPAAYPRWYLDGFGEMFATIRVRTDGALEYGHMPEGYNRVIQAFGQVPVQNVLDGKYLDQVARKSKWTPFHAWILTHYLFFSEKRRPQLSRYLSAIARGESLGEAAKAFGDVAKLQAEVIAYDNRGLPYDRFTYPPERAPEPVITQLTEGQARFLKGRIELGSRVELPPEPAPDLDAKSAKRVTDYRRHAIEARDKWLARLRENAATWSTNIEAQLLLTEAECRMGNYDNCIAAADRALGLKAASSPALAWKGLAMAEKAIAGPAADRAAGLKEARAVIVRANRADDDAALPLIAYFRSFADAGEDLPPPALAGMLKVIDGVPAAPAPRLMLGTELAREGQAAAARKLLLPVADSGYDSPEKPKAQAVLQGLPAK
jgi:hypothetical protein